MEPSTFKIEVGTCTVSFPREKFMTTFPYSMLTSALEHDPNVDTIRLEEKSVTPNILEFLRNILLYEAVPSVPRSEPLAEAGKYLGIDLLPVVDKFQYDDIKYINLVNPKAITKQNYIRLMIYATTKDYPELFRYVLDRTNPSEYQDQDQKLLSIAVLKNNISFVRLFLRRGIDPTQSFLTQNEVDRLGLIYPKDVPGDYWLQLLFFALNVGSDELITLLLESGQFKLNHGGEEVLRLALHRTNSQIVAVLMSAHFPITKEQIILDTITTFPKLFPTLMENPHFNSRSITRAIIKLMDRSDTVSYIVTLDAHSETGNVAHTVVKLYHAVRENKYEMIPVYTAELNEYDVKYDARTQLSALVDRVYNVRVADALHAVGWYVWSKRSLYAHLKPVDEPLCPWVCRPGTGIGPELDRMRVLGLID